MREIVDSQRLQEFMSALGKKLRSPTRVYLTGGASAVLEGWRGSTMDVDVKFDPDSEVFELLPEIKERLRINIELASPADFIPALPGWEDRSQFISQVGAVQFRHYDFYSQALSKIERGFDRDVDDVRQMVRRGLVDPAKLKYFADEIQAELIRYPAIDPEAFLLAVDRFIETLESS